MSDAPPSWTSDGGYECCKLPQYSLEHEDVQPGARRSSSRDYPPIDQRFSVAVESFHQDGNRHVAMLIVDRQHQADSGVSQYETDDDGTIGDEMVFDAVGHRGRRRIGNGARGSRDIVTVSAKEPPAHVPMAPIPDRLKDWRSD